MTQTDAHSHFTLNPLLWLAASFALGIAAAEFLPGYASLIVYLALAAPLAMAVRGGRIAALLIFLGFCGLGAADLQLEKASISPDRIRAIYDAGIIASAEPVEIEGVLTRPPEPAFEAFVFTLDALQITYRGTPMTATGRIRIYLPLNTEEGRADFERLNLQAGSRILAACGLEREDRFLNPGVMPRRRTLDILGIDAACTIKSPLLIEKVGQDAKFLPLKNFYAIRTSLIEHFQKRLSTPTAGMIIAANLGDKYFLDRETADIFRIGGTFHILVISGLHITFLGGLALLVISLLTSRPWLRFITANTFLWLFTVVVGSEAPVVRASVMFTMLSFAHLIYRPASMLNALGASALLLLAVKPSDFFDPSFQLTFVSLSAIVTTAFPLIARLRAIGNWSPTAETPFPPRVPSWLMRFCETLHWSQRAWEINVSREVWSARLFKAPWFQKLADFGIRRPLVFAFEGLILSAIVQLWMLPLLAVYFHRFVPVSVLLNLWVGPMMVMESAAAFAGVIFSGISEAFAAPLFAFSDLIGTLLIYVPGLFRDAALTGGRTPVFSGYGQIIYPLAVAASAASSLVVLRWEPFSLIGRRRREIALWISAGGIAIVLLAVILIHPGSSPPVDGLLTADFLDVGQGDAALVTFPNGETMLIDGGGSPRFADDTDGPAFEPDVPRIGEAVVSEFVWERGYSRIDYLLATHADADHMQGLADVARNFKIGTAVFGRMPADDPEIIELTGILKNNGVPIRETFTGESFEIGGARVDVLNPPRPSAAGDISGNNESLVLKITFGRRVILFTGDIERETEERLLNSGTSLGADVVKVAHHGSRTSSILEFVDAVRPAYSIISVGRRSTFGHPHQEVVNRWQASGAAVMTTGEKGMITITTDGQSLDVKQFMP